MSKPVISQTIGGYEFRWKEGIYIRVSRLRVQNSDGQVKGEIIIKNEKSTLYPQTYINFSADRTRNTLVKSLSSRYSEHDWQGIIDQLSYHLQEKTREGEPIIELDTTEDIKPPKYLIYPFIIANQPNVIFGPPESGKTQIAMTLCVAMILPWTNNPLNLGVPSESCVPLWLDYEADKDTTHWNFKRIASGIGVEYLSLPYRRCRAPLADDIEQIAGHMDKVKANCVVIDSLAKAAGGDLDKSESPSRFFAALDQLRCTSLIIAHTSKGSDGGRKSIYGSTLFEAYSRSIWEIKASHEGETLYVGLWDNKANFRRKLEPVAYTLSYDDEHIFINIEDIKTVDDFMKHLSVNSRIAEALKDGSKSPAELKEILSDVPGATFYAELARMVKKNKIIKMGVGRDISYGLPYQEK
ncbi:MAG: AAA family ATPase [Dehalococcoidales bacterium]|nr:AAA family ATPase [Dehalococcoidales bacterium]